MVCFFLGRTISPIVLSYIFLNPARLNSIVHKVVIPSRTMPPEDFLNACRPSSSIPPAPSVYRYEVNGVKPKKAPVTPMLAMKPIKNKANPNCGPNLALNPFNPTEKVAPTKYTQKTTAFGSMER